jgi:sulfotransferase family protein
VRQLRTSRQAGPVAIGGVGGSGTRLVADMVLELGFYLGADLNFERDNLWFTLLFKRPEWYAKEHAGDASGIHVALRLFERVMIGGRRPSMAELRLLLCAATRVAVRGRPPTGRGRGIGWPWGRVRSMLRAGPADLDGHRGWGWKEPNTHIFLPQLADHFDDLTYVHVIRHGVDMAYGRNQFQLHNWGSLFGVEPPASPELVPRASLRYWARSNLRAVELGERLLGPRFLLLNYDALCRDPETGVDALLAFLGCSVSAAKRGRLVSLPRRAPKRRDREMAPVEVEDARALSRLGFDAVEEAL